LTRQSIFLRNASLFEVVREADDGYAGQGRV
jgi:hypothetical protein